MDATSYAGDRRTDASVRLSRDQKRDIASMVVAAVITAGLIVAPAIAPRDQAVALLASRSVEPIAGSPLLVDVRFEPPVVVTPRARVRTAGITRRSLTSSPVSIATPVAAMPDVVTVSARMDTPRRPLARRLAGFLTGDGTHTIRPFPTVSTERQ
jgi:hypothetical protein